jgi:hypothetical protein
MKKKFQVVLPMWMEDYLSDIANEYDLTISELLRLELSLAIICFVSHFFPEYEGPSMQDLGIPLAAEAPSVESLDREKMHRVLSKIYFEARKAAEYHKGAEKQERS